MALHLWCHSKATILVLLILHISIRAGKCQLYSVIISIELNLKPGKSIYFFLIENVTAPSNGDNLQPITIQSNGTNANTQPELIEYYDVDDAPVVTDTIYPNPDELLLRSNRHNYDYIADWNNRIKGVTAKFSELKETDSGSTSHEFIHHITEFRGKSIDFDGTSDDINDADLRDHDLIDNFMYIYYGSNVTVRKNLGGSIIIVGTVFALAAQILTTVFTMLRNR